MEEKILGEILIQEDIVEDLDDSSYSVILFDDPKISGDLVTEVLVEVFSLRRSDAFQKVIECTRCGNAFIRGGYSFSEAQDKVNKAVALCKEKGSRRSLNFTIEEE